MPAMVFEGGILHWGFQMETVSGITWRDRLLVLPVPGAAVQAHRSKRSLAQAKTVRVFGLGDWKHSKRRCRLLR